jgi:hypothetical protein
MKRASRAWSPSILRPISRIRPPSRVRRNRSIRRGPLELVGMSIAPDDDGSPFADPQIALAQRHFLAFGQGHQLLDRPIHQAGIGWMAIALGWTVVSATTRSRSFVSRAPVL